MDGMPEAEPTVVVKPKFPNFFSPKFLAGLTILIMIGVSFLGYKFLYKPSAPPKPQQVAQVAPENILRCPLDGNICGIDTSFKESSLSAVLEDPSPIYAVFDGVLEKQSKKKNESTVVLLTNKEKGLQAVYYFMDAITIGSSQVKEGDVIAVANGSPIRHMDNKSFVLHLLDIGKAERTLIPLLPKSFKL